MYFSSLSTQCANDMVTIIASQTCLGHYNLLTRNSEGHCHAVLNETLSDFNMLVYEMLNASRW